MKNTDIAMIVLVAGISIGIAFVIGNSVLPLAPPKEGVKVDTIKAITSDVEEPDPTVFNADAINPTVPVVIQQTDQPTE